LNGKPHIERKKKHGFCFRYSLQPTQWVLTLFWLVVDLPLWKMMEWKSVGMMTFPIYGKS
jgi:hypothetical protein